MILYILSFHYKVNDGGVFYNNKARPLRRSGEYNPQATQYILPKYIILVRKLFLPWESSSSSSSWSCGQKVMRVMQVDLNITTVVLVFIKVLAKVIS